MTLIFHLMTSGAKPNDLMSNLIQKRYRGIKTALQYFFEFFLGIILLEIIGIACQKIAIFSKLDIW